MNRQVVAFLVAPLVVPMFAALEFRSLLVADSFFAVMILGASALTAYAGTFLLGIPAYLFLRAKKWTTFWLAPALGFVGGGLGWWFFLSLRWSGPPFEFRPPSDLSWLLDILWPYGPLGALVGALLWLIARPDRAGNRKAVAGGSGNDVS